MRRLTAAALIAGAVVAGIVTAAAAPSPVSDGQVIAYVGHGTIYVVNADGTGRRPLISGVADNTFSWSPDGRWIAFTAGKWGADESEIKVASAEGTGVRLLSPNLPNAAGEPTWSPDGMKLAFTAWNGRWSLFIVNVDGTGIRELTHRPANDQTPDWSPDGRWIVFDRFTYANPRSTVMAIHPDGTGLHRIASVITGPQCSCPDWSPDGAKITYQASPTVSTSKYPEIFVMNANGGGQAQLTHNPARDENPDWSPDGTRIAFYSERPGNAEIYVMNADGSNLKRVTRDPWYSALPRWRPTG